MEGRSVFKLVDEEAGKSNEKGGRIRGGHRLWVAPEDFGKKDGLTYAPDNSQVEHAIDDEFTVRVSRVLPTPLGPSNTMFSARCTKVRCASS